MSGVKFRGGGGGGEWRSEGLVAVEGQDFATVNRDRRFLLVSIETSHSPVDLEAS